MNFRIVTSSDELWCKVRNYAESCSWGAGKTLAGAMDHNGFNDWERVIVAVDNEKICGYCTVSKTDCIPDVEYTPYIGFMFVDEEYRGNRLSQQLIEYAIDYIKNIGYNKVYIVSDHENFYEKYGFRVIDRKIAPWGSEEKIYIQDFNTDNFFMEETMKNTNQLIGCCGLDCEKCDARIATITNDNALREKTAALWTKLNGVTITTEMINCTGCRIEGAKTPFCDKLCPVHNCVREKGLDTCADCLQMDGCPTLGCIAANSPFVLENLNKLREMTTEKGDHRDE